MTQGEDMAGRTVVVTGASSGIGLETAAVLAAAGAKVVLTARDAARGQRALDEVRQRSNDDRAELVVFDLASTASIRRGAAEVLDRCERLDVLVNNAGLVLSSRTETVDGFEMTFAVNHLGPFLLTVLLLDRLKASAPARVVTVASTAHRQARRGLDFDDLQSTRRYRAMDVYSKSKLANILFTTELARRLRGTGVTANCCHPGTVASGFAADHDAAGLLAVGLRLGRPFFISPAKGAATSVYLASSAAVAGVTGGYFSRSRQATPSRPAQDAAAAARLWDVSEALVSSTVP